MLMRGEARSGEDGEKADWVIRDGEKPWPSGIFYSAPSALLVLPLDLS